MLSKINRLKKEKDFKEVLKKGSCFKEDFLVIKVKKNNLKNNRFGFIITKNFSKKASLRNKIKRRLSEIIRLKLKEIKTGFDIIFIINVGLKNKDFWEIEEIVKKILIKAKLLNF